MFWNHQENKEANQPPDSQSDYIDRAGAELISKLIYNTDKFRMFEVTTNCRRTISFHEKFPETHIIFDVIFLSYRTTT